MSALGLGWPLLTEAEVMSSFLLLRFHPAFLINRSFETKKKVWQLEKSETGNGCLALAVDDEDCKQPVFFWQKCFHRIFPAWRHRLHGKKKRAVN